MLLGFRNFMINTLKKKIFRFQNYVPVTSSILLRVQVGKNLKYFEYGTALNTLRKY